MKEERDIFNKKLQEHLYNAEMTPREDMWSRIEVSLDKSSRRGGNRVRTIVMSALTAAAVAVIALIVYREDSGEVIPAEIASMVQVAKEINTPTTSITPTNNNLTAAAIETVTVADKVKEIQKPRKQLKVSETIEATKIVAATKVENKKIIAPTNTTQERSVDNRMVGTSKNNVTAYASKKKAKNDMVFNISSGLSSSTTNQLMSNADYAYEAPTVVHSLRDRSINGGFMSPTVYGNETNTEERNWEHRPPITLSVTALKMLNRVIGIESGLSYTMLQSTSYGEKELDTDIKSRYHYIGIPINLYVQLLKSEKFALYGKAGVMVDKCVSANVTTTIGDLSTVERPDIDGVQVTGNLQLGVGYNISNTIALYIEPTLSYFADNNQPQSYRTDNTFGFSAMAGIRLNLW